MVRMPLRQWALKITKYADQLEAGLQGLQWPEGTLTAQRQWIGRSEGARCAVKESENVFLATVVNFQLKKCMLSNTLIFPAGSNAKMM